MQLVLLQAILCCTINIHVYSPIKAQPATPPFPMKWRMNASRHDRVWIKAVPLLSVQ